MRTTTIVKLAATLAGMYMSIYLMYTFYHAYLSPTKSIIFYVNRQGEANLELIILTPVILIIIIGGLLVAKGLLEELLGIK